MQNQDTKIFEFCPEQPQEEVQRGSLANWVFAMVVLASWESVHGLVPANPLLGILADLGTLGGTAGRQRHLVELLFELRQAFFQPQVLHQVAEHPR